MFVLEICIGESEGFADLRKLLRKRITIEITEFFITTITEITEYVLWQLGQSDSEHLTCILGMQVLASHVY